MSVVVNSCPWWCSTDHSGLAGQRAHRLDFGPFEGAPGHELTIGVIQQEETLGTPGELLVRICDTANNNTRVMEIAPSSAADMGDLMLGLSNDPAIQRFAATLIGTFWVTGGFE